MFPTERVAPFKKVAGNATGVSSEKGMLSTQFKLISNRVLTESVSTTNKQACTVVVWHSLRENYGIDEDVVRTRAFVTISPRESTLLLVVVGNVGVVVGSGLVHGSIRIFFKPCDGRVGI